MIFAHTWQKVLDGTKTRTTRRAYRYQDEIVPVRYAVGKTYAVQQKRGGRGVARVRIVSVDLLENLQAIDEDYARQEGFDSLESFRAAFLRVNGTGLDEPVHSICFELIK